MKLTLLLLTTALVAANAGKNRPGVVSKLDTGCYGADSYSAAQITSLTAITAATNSAGTQWRSRVYLPAVSASAIALVTDSTLCARGLAAFNNAAALPSGPADKVYLFGVGNMYVAANPNFPAGEWVEHYVFDSTFTLKATYLK